MAWIVPGGRPFDSIDTNISTNAPEKKRVPKISIPPSSDIGKQEEEMGIMTQRALEFVKSSVVTRVVRFSSAESLERRLVPGDIFLTYEPENIDWKGAMIRFGNMARRAVHRGDDWREEGSNFVHASIYAGEGKMCEAITGGVRQSPLAGERFTLGHGAHKGYLVVHLNNEMMAKEACRIAEALSVEKPEEEALFPYAYCKLVPAELGQGTLDDEGLISYLKGAVTSYCGMQPWDENGIHDFFCSHFVGWACQAAESTEVIERVNKRLPKDKQIVFPDLSEIKIDKTLVTETDLVKRQEEILKLEKTAIGKIIHEWAEQVAKAHGNVIKEEINLKFNPGKMTPQVFYNFVLDHPELFTVKLFVIPPKK